MNVWQTSLLYKLWVIGGLVGIVAFAVIGGLSDPTNQDFVLYLIPVIAFWVAGIFVLQWRGLRKEVRENPDTAEPVAGLVGWNIGFGAILCACVFIGVFAYYAGVRETLYPLGETGPGVPIVLVPAVLLVFYGAARTLNLMRDFGGR